MSDLTNFDPNKVADEIAALESEAQSSWTTAKGEHEAAAIFRNLTGREHEPGVRCEELIAIIGRRGGKTEAIARWRVTSAHVVTIQVWYPEKLASVF
jgi:hypothetical protein